MRQDATMEMWRELYQAAEKIKKLKPWEYLSDKDFMIICLPGRESPVFCQIKGKCERNCEIYVYRDKDDFINLDMLRQEEKMNLPMDYLKMEQSMLVCYFTGRKNIFREQRKIIRDVGIKFRGEGNWISFQSFQKRCNPNIPDRQEVNLLLETYQNVWCALKDLIEKNVAADFERGEGLWRGFEGGAEREAGRWKTFPKLIPEWKKEFPCIKLGNPVLEEQLTKEPDIALGIALDFVYADDLAAEQNSSHFFHPLFLVAIDDCTGFVVAVKPVEPGEEEVQAVLNFFVEFIMKYGRMQWIKARNPWIFSALEELSVDCHVLLQEDELKSFDQVKRRIQSYLSLRA